MICCSLVTKVPSFITPICPMSGVGRRADFAEGRAVAAFGTFQTWLVQRAMSAFGVNRTQDFGANRSVHDPTET